MDYTLFPPDGNGISIIPTTCINNCGGKCILRAHVKHGVLLHITSDEISDENSLISPQLRACAKGRAYVRRLYDPARLKVPLMRTGPRGSGQYKPISWEEALNRTASELLRIRESHGPAAVLDMSCSGAFGGKFHQRATDRFLNMFGSRTILTGSYSSEATDVMTEIMYGTQSTGNDRADLLNAKIIIMWGFNPGETTRGTNTAWFIARARENGTRVICLDPVMSDSAAALADEWIPIRPGSDAAVMMAMAYTMIVEDLMDADFLRQFTSGFDNYRAYILGEQDGIPKSPLWASQKSGTPATTIIELARLYASKRPGALICGWSLQRTAYGETPVRTAIILAAMTGNIGIPGGNAAGADYSRVPYMSGLNVGSLPDPSAKVPIYLWPDLILSGKTGGFPSNIKAVYLTGSNLVNQGADINKNIKAMQIPEFIVCHEQFMTPTAKYADIILPVNTFLERNDIAFPGTRQGNYFLFANQVVESLDESKSDYDIFCLLAEKMGFGEKYSEGKKDLDWLRELAASSDIPDFETFRQTGIWRDKRKKPHVAFTEQIQRGKPFNTPSGRIEIFSQQIAAMDDPPISPIPQYVDPWESPADPLAQQYPLQLVTPHSKHRVNSSQVNNPWLSDLRSHQIWINPVDAEIRGIGHNDWVRVYNKRGEMLISAFVTGRIMPGVVNIFQGSWVDFDDSGTDRGGATNVLNSGQPTPFAKASTTHTTLVEIEKSHIALEE
jgi:anaerobic dimethyl sulfoxide reductase subunit A